MNQENQHSPATYDAQMNRLFANWEVFSEDVRVVKRREFRAVWEEIGEDRFAIGVTKIINEGKYKMFPIVAEFRGFVPERKIGTRRRDCGCGGSGWLVVLAGTREKAPWDTPTRDTEARKCDNPDCRRPS